MASGSWPARSGGIRLLARTVMTALRAYYRHLRVRSLLIDGEVVWCDNHGLMHVATI